MQLASQLCFNCWEPLLYGMIHQIPKYLRTCIYLWQLFIQLVLKRVSLSTWKQKQIPRKILSSQTERIKLFLTLLVCGWRVCFTLSYAHAAMIFSWFSWPVLPCHRALPLLLLLLPPLLGNQTQMVPGTDTSSLF